jgi:hypothetical protein
MTPAVPAAHFWPRSTFTRIAMAILRHSRIALTMEIYTQVPDKVTREALRRLSDWLDRDEDQGDEAAYEPSSRSALLYFAAAAPRGAVLYRPRSGQR